MTSWVKPQSQSSQMMISPLTERELDYGKFVDKCHHQFRNPVDRVSRPLDLSSVSRQAKITRGGYIFFYFFIFLFFLFCAQFFFIFFITTFITTLLHHNTLIYKFYKLYYAYCRIRIKCQRLQIQHNVILIRNKILCQCLQIQHNNIL